MVDWSKGIYAKQFIVGPHTARVRNIEPRASGGSTTAVGAHRLLVVTSHSVGKTHMVALGHLMDPQHPERGNADVLKHLADNLTSFRALEERTASLGGRWALIAEIRGESRLYPDATGTKSIFHTVSADGAVWAASQPNLLSEALGVLRDEDAWSRFRSHPCSASSWPCDLTPFQNVRQLLPNHYLDLGTGEVVRFWPVEGIAHQTIELAAEHIVERLHGIMAATVARGTTATPLSGGYDSRTLYASAGSLRSKMQFFSIRGMHLPHHDFVLPQKLTRIFGDHMQIVPAQRYPKEFWSTLQHNVAGMWWDPSDYMMYTFGSLGADFLLHGMISEIARCFYYEDGEHPQTLSPRNLADLARYRGHPMAIESFSRWLAGVPRVQNLNTLDLFYWEHRVANWASMQCTGLDLLVDPIAPYNCRDLLTAGLGVHAAMRRAPHALHREICRRAEPRTLEVPFNAYWLDDVEEQLQRLVPWRIKNAYRQARMRRAGFS
jgi:hypothetical protein